MGQSVETGVHREDAAATVIIVDDDADARASIDSLCRSVGLSTLLFSSAKDLIETPLPVTPCCFVLDVLMPQLTGLEFQARLVTKGSNVPIVFVTGHGDIPMTVKAMKAGAVDVLTKPFREQDLLDAVATALERHRTHRDAARELAAHRASHASLTPREREVMGLAVRGLTNRQAAGELGLSEITVKLHRASMLRKMGARTVADLVKMAEALGLHTG